jgi:hypothetical protein
MQDRRTSDRRFGCAIWATMFFPPVILFAAQPAKAPATNQPSAWRLAGREGECAPLTILSKKGADYGTVTSPKELAEKLRANGHQAELKEFKAGIRPAVEVRAPSAGIHVMFVRQEHCDKKLPGAEKK